MACFTASNINLIGSLLDRPARDAGGSLSELLVREKTGLAVENSDIKSIRRGIIDMYHRYKSDSLNATLTFEDVSKYSVSELASRLEDIWETAIRDEVSH